MTATQIHALMRHPDAFGMLLRHVAFEGAGLRPRADFTPIARDSAAGRRMLLLLTGRGADEAALDAVEEWGASLLMVSNRELVAQGRTSTLIEAGWCLEGGEGTLAFVYAGRTALVNVDWPRSRGFEARPTADGVLQPVPAGMERDPTLLVAALNHPVHQRLNAGLVAFETAESLAALLPASYTRRSVRDRRQEHTRLLTLGARDAAGRAAYDLRQAILKGLDAVQPGTDDWASLHTAALLTAGATRGVRLPADRAA